MKRNHKSADRLARLATLGLCLPLGGCDGEWTAELAALSGAFLGDVVSSTTTWYLQRAWGVDGDAEALGDAHSHDAAPLHDHEH